MTLTHDDVALLADVGMKMQYYLDNYTHTAMQIAASLLTELRNTNVTNNTLVEFMGDTVMGNSSLTRDDMEVMLEKFAYLPTDRRSGHAALWISIVIISGIVVAMRLYSRLRWSSSGLKLVDWVLLFAWLIAAANNGEDAYLVLYRNWEAHCWDMNLSDINKHSEIAAVDYMLGATCQFLFKVALLLFYYEIYTSKWFRWSTYFMGFVVTVYMVISYVFFAIRCSPFDHWNHAPGSQKCIKYDLELFIALTAVNIPIDMIIVGLPIIPIFKLQLSTAKKLCVILLIGVGVLVCIASVLRLTTLKEYVSSPDVSQRALNATTWQLMEVHLGIICSSVPSMRKVIQMFAGHWKDIQEERRTGSRTYTKAGSIVEILRRVSTGGWQPSSARKGSTWQISQNSRRSARAVDKHKPSFTNYEMKTDSGSMSVSRFEKEDPLGDRESARDQKVPEVSIV